MSIKFTIFIIFVLQYTATFGQLLPNTFPATGNVGIGTTTPTEKLDVNGNIRLSSNSGLIDMPPSGTNDENSDLTIKAGDGLSTAQGGDLILNGGNCSESSSQPGSVYISGGNTSNTFRSGAVYISRYGTTTIGLFTTSIPKGFQLGINGHTIINGKLLFGNVTNSNIPGGYDIYAPNGMLAGLFKIAKYGGKSWSDFVFNKEYKLNTLDAVETYINKNHHLPEIPSAKEVEENGFELAEMDAKLLQKIEELTLYVIELNKKNSALEKEVNKLKKRK